MLEEMSVPLLVGVDLLHGHDVKPRVANRQVVVDEPAERLVTRMWTMAEVIQAIGEVQDEVYTPVWHDLARSVGARDSAAQGRHVTEKAVIPPRTMKAIIHTLRYPRQVQLGELFAVEVECATVRIRDQTAAEQQLASVQGWDLARGVVCDGHATVMVFNMYDHPITVEPGVISATVCPMMEVTTHYRVRSDGRTANEEREKNRGGPERRVNAGHKEMEQGRPPEFPEFLWRLVAPSSCRINLIGIMYGLKIHPDNKMVRTPPWMKSVKESLETPEGRKAHRKEAAAQWNLEIHHHSHGPRGTH